MGTLKPAMDTDKSPSKDFVQCGQTHCSLEDRQRTGAGLSALLLHMLFFRSCSPSEKQNPLVLGKDIAWVPVHN